MPFNKPEPEHEGKPLSRWVAETKDKDSMVRLHAALALGEIGPAAIPALTELLKDKNWHVRHNAVWALKAVGPASIPALTELLQDKDWHVRSEAAWALGKRGSEAKLAIPFLVELLQDMNGAVRQAVVWALGKIAPPSKEAHLRQLDATKPHSSENTLLVTDGLLRQARKTLKDEHIVDNPTLMKIRNAKSKDEMICCMVAARKAGYS